MGSVPPRDSTLGSEQCGGGFRVCLEGLSNSVKISGTKPVWYFPTEHLLSIQLSSVGGSPFHLQPPPPQNTWTTITVTLAFSPHLSLLFLPPSLFKMDFFN